VKIKLEKVVGNECMKYKSVRKTINVFKFEIQISKRVGIKKRIVIKCIL
jgi:hypothetical protein